MKYSELRPKDTIYFRIYNHNHINRSHWYFKSIAHSLEHYPEQIFGILRDGLFYYVEH